MVGSKGRLGDLSLYGPARAQNTPLRYPEFLSKLMALTNLMLSSLTKTAHADMFGTANQDFGYAR
jgi:hypothetical protein